MEENRRVQRVEKQLQQIVAKYLTRGLRYPLYGLVTVSRVESNPKLRTAKVLVSILGTEEDKKMSMESLQNSLHDIQQHINKELRMKFVPRISIVLDLGLEKLLIVESKLREIALEAAKKNNS